MRLAVWARTQAEAATAIKALGVADAFAVGNRSADSLRGRTFDAVLILPGAESDAVFRNLYYCTVSGGPHVPWLDLR